MDDGELRETIFDEHDIIDEYDVVDEEENSIYSEDEDLEQDTQMVAADDPDDSVHSFTGHKKPVLTVACSPTDATLVATGGEDNKGFIWNIGQGDQTQEISGHTDSVTSLAFSFDGKLLASASFDGLVQIWDVCSVNLTRKRILSGPTKGIEFVKWHPREHIVLAGSEDMKVWLWNADTGDYQKFVGHEASVTCGDFTPDAKRICTGSNDASLRIWENGEKFHVVKGHPYHTAPITCLTITCDSNFAITGSEDGSVHVVNIATGKVLHSLLSHSASVECVGISPSLFCVATGGLDQGLIFSDMHNTQRAVCRCICPDETNISCLQWLGASRYIVTGCTDGNILIWDRLSEKCMKTFRGHTDNITSLSVSSNGEFLVSSSMDTKVLVFKLAEIGNQT
ncbi:hypothetical protein ACHQM5_030858 [Ranunculus cassubicifolius]